MHIAIDGPTGAGKSTVARELARRLGIIYVDTGAMYRAAAYTALRLGVDTGDEKALEELMKGLALEVWYDKGSQHISVNGEDVTEHLRTPEVSMAAAAISRFGAVRGVMVALQQAFCEGRDVVMDGRDIGTVVLPGAQFKFYITALPEVRARRRYDELIGGGQCVSYEEVYRDIVKRDKQDMDRDLSPLVKAQDAIELDASGLPFAAEIEKLMDIIKNG